MKLTNKTKNPRSWTEAMLAHQREDVRRLFFWDEISGHENFVLAAVKGDYGERVCEFFTLAVLVSVPKDIRMERVKERSFGKFGARMLPGGDLYESENRFFELVRSRSEDTVENWAGCLSCPVLRVDGTKPLEDNIAEILKHI